MEPSTTNFTDHDLLIRLDTRMQGLETEMRLMRDGTTADIKDLKVNKLDRTEFVDYKVASESLRREKVVDLEKAILAVSEDLAKETKKTDWIMKMIFIGVGILGTIEFVAPLVLHYYFHI